MNLRKSALNTPSSKEGMCCKLEIWDTLGQERYSSLVNNFYNSAAGVIIAYDITDMQTYLNVKSWLLELEE